MRAEPPNEVPKALPPNAITSGVGFQYMNFEVSEIDHSRTYWKKFSNQVLFLHQSVIGIVVKVVLRCGWETVE